MEREQRVKMSQTKATDTAADTAARPSDGTGRQDTGRR